MKRSRLLPVFLVLSLVLMMLSSSAGAAAPKSNGTKEPFSLSLRALKGPTHTDLYLNVSSSDPATAAPSALQKIQLKSFTKEGELVYTKNIKEVASPGGAAVLQLTDVERYQPLKTQVLAKTAQTVDQEVLEATATVLLRPDLVVDQVNAPAQALVNVPFSVQVGLKETNTDLGATAKVSILNGSAVLDQAQGVVVPAGGAKAVAMALQFAEPGTYTLRVAISGADPAEYDTTNNEALFTVNVISPNKTMSYWANYWRYSYEANSDYSYDWYGSRQYRYLDEYENFSTSWWTEDQINPSGSFDLTLTTDSGATQQISLSGVSLVDNGWAKVYYGYLPDKNATVHIYQYPWGGTNVEYSSWSGRYYYSDNWYYWYGYGYTYGEMLNARTSLKVDLDLLGSNGTHYGGSYTLSITPQEYSWDNTWYGWWGEYGHDWGHQSWYNGWGNGQTNW